eukprot:GABV01000157.1.p1 GENE.GABV01000157.1~~GABV01000157.1.p1  ORF type:complete len:277 (-),score=95.43 GABV01000157.1:504-1334(-)
MIALALAQPSTMPNPLEAGVNIVECGKIQKLGKDHLDGSTLGKKKKRRRWYYHPSSKVEPWTSRWEGETADFRLESRATVIVCASHLVEQWRQEIERHVKGNPCVVEITTKPKHEKAWLWDLLMADFVIVSTQFISGKYFKDYHGLDVVKHLMGQSANPFVTKQPTTKPKRSVLFNRLGSGFVGAVHLKHIYWHRIVLDEAHECFFNTHAKIVELFKGRHRWFVTGTPPKKKRLCLRFLNFWIFDSTGENWIELNCFFGCERLGGFTFGGSSANEF